MKYILFALCVTASTLGAQNVAPQLGITTLQPGTSLIITSWFVNGVLKSDTVRINVLALPIAKIIPVEVGGKPIGGDYLPGRTFCVNAVAQDSTGKVVPNVPFVFTSSDTTVAKIVVLTTCASGAAVKVP